MIQMQNLFLHNWMNELFLQENKVPEHCLEL